ncbi:MAG TPA: NAD+ synthase [Candidatus Acidoferrum sp.]|nr:NAD+ synthase [Candidatus Acidoferrum sp.]
MPDNTAKSRTFRIAMAQLNPLVGDIPGNARLVLDSARDILARQQTDLIVFPELVLTAYPPEDLLLRPSLDGRIEQALRMLCEAALPTTLAVGYPGRVDGKLHNRLAVIRNGAIVGHYSKQQLPNYRVFDEKRYFEPGTSPLVLDFDGLPVAFTICEDLWFAEPMRQAAAASAALVVNINGSPYSRGKHAERLRSMRQRVAETGLPLIYVNQVGGQDELVFDGASMALGADGSVRVQAAQFGGDVQFVHVQHSRDGGKCKADILQGTIEPLLEPSAELYAALRLGLRDYVEKNRFKGVVLGLSGGIDSALTLALAVDALGKERVKAVMMPFDYTAEMSQEDAAEEAAALGVDYSVVPIGPMYHAFMQSLQREFAGTKADLAEQNLQARCRGVLLMAISNKHGLLVLTTGNKSEMAVGYSTLYGDMAGGFDVLKDVPKMLVYALAEYRNSVSAVIPRRVIERAPSAELAPGQVDEDNLPPYPVLDRILELYVDHDQSLDAICQQGFERAVVEKVIRMVDRNEYKRRQAPVGVRISERGFGRDRRYPITSGWQPGD